MNRPIKVGIIGCGSVSHSYLPVLSKSPYVELVSERTVGDKEKIRVEEEDNAMVLMDHGNGVISHVQSGFNYFNPHGHDGRKETRHT